MFETLPEIFRTFGIPADTRTILLFRKAIEKGLVRTLGDIFHVLKGLLVREPTMMGPFTKAFYFYFLAIDIKNGEKLNDAIARAETFKNWKEKNQFQHVEHEDINQQIEAFLDEVHLTSYDIQSVINGKEAFVNDNPDLADDTIQENHEAKKLDKMADYSELSLEELLERMRKVEAQQKSKHTGGSHWIGSGGTSPYGNGGAAKNGIRVAGNGGGKMARAVLNDKNYYPVDIDAELKDDNMDAALAALKGIFEESAQEYLDVENTIKEGLKRGGLFLPEIKSINQQKLQVLLFIDNGGYSMMSYVRIVQKLFKKMKTRFAHDLETFYFHNTIYGYVYSEASRRNRVKIEKILKKDANYCVFIIGDASMAEYEITQESVDCYESIMKKFKKTVWINPEDEKYWFHSPTIQLISKIVPMFAMTPRGIENAVKEMNKKSSSIKV